MDRDIQKRHPGDRAGHMIEARSIVARRRWLLLNAGIAVVGLLVLALIRQALVVDGAGVARVGVVLSALRSHGVVELLFFGAAASGYMYWCVQFLAGSKPVTRRRALVANLAFAATVGMASAALLLWNVALIAGPSAG
jgi:hypothetical protein